MPWVKSKLRFEFSIAELDRLKEFASGRGTCFDDYDKKLLRKLSNCISQLEALEEKQKFRKSCLLSSPSDGFCREEKQYNYCLTDKNIKNNWMCWRDGVLEDVQSSTPKVKKNATD